METNNVLRVIISGGGTGGHIFPAIAIANAIKEKVPNVELLFIGAKKRMEMEKVPAAGYPIEGINIVGIQRKAWWKNVLFPIKLGLALLNTRKIIKRFKPDVVVGVGGYASGPALLCAHGLKIPTLIQEQNSFPGITNRFLAKKASIICVDYEGMEKYFPARKTIWTGNPIRQDVVDLKSKKEEALAFFGVDPQAKVILVMGGSLGAATINASILAALDLIEARNCTLLWQTGKYYYKSILEKVGERKNLHIMEFIGRMDLAYSLADVIVSRAGAISISELCVVGKPLILIPSPNVAEDHQTKNALALSSKNAAILLPDAEAEEQLGVVLLDLLKNENRCNLLSKNIMALAKVNAAAEIADEIIKLSCKKN